MRTWALGVGVAVTVVTTVALWWLNNEEPSPPSEPEPQAVVPTPLAAPASSAPAPALVEEKAATPVEKPEKPKPVDVRFQLLRKDKPVVGERITLRRGGETIGGTLNVMGSLTLPLSPGDWSVLEPRLAAPRSVHVNPEGGDITLTLTPEGAITGCVTDPAKNPLLAMVYARAVGDDGRFGPAQNLTRNDGCFSVTVTGEEAEVWVEAADHVSAVKRVPVPSTVALVATPTFDLAVEFPDVREVRVAVTHALGATQGRCWVRLGTSRCILHVPPGDYELRAYGFRDGKLRFVRHAGTAASADSELQLSMSVAPPIEGVVRDAQGVPLPNVPLHFISTGPRAVELTRALSGDNGAFMVEPVIAGELRGLASPSWKIISEPPWTLAPAMVTLGDNPLELTAALTPPEAQRQ